MRTLLAFSLATLVTSCLLAARVAADTEKKEPTEHYITVGEVEAVLKSATSTSITLQSNQARTAKTKEAKDQPLELTSDCKVRLRHLPPLLDDKGKKTFRTPEELTKLKGTSNLPGYEAEISDLKPNQIVKITIVKSKPATATEAPKLFVKRIIIEKDIPAAKGDKKPEEKKKT